MPTETDLLQSQSLYYCYKPKSFIRRIISLIKASPVYCERCARSVSTASLVMGVAISEASLKAPDKSSVVQLFRDKDWSILNRAERPTDWYHDPTLRIELGRCHICDGPFFAFGKVQGMDNNTMLLGAVFLGEFNHLEAAALIETALKNDLFANDDYFAKAIATCKTLGSRIDFDKIVSERETRLAAMQLGQRAMMDFHKGNLDRAKESLNSVLQTFTALNEKPSQFITLINLASVQIQLNNLDEAEQLLRESKPLIEELGNPKNTAMCFGLLGTIYRQRGGFEYAESMFRNALQAEIESDDKAGIATAFRELGELYETKNRPGQARDAYSEALKIYEQMDEMESVKAVKKTISKLST